ncbi:MAG TPA: 3D domain-containing protein [Pyrinomonadaceae bacterium]|nr:3D domain-containing protein [Pyrinomonadaceae bacterium]
MDAADKVNLGDSVVKEETFVVPATHYVATAYSLRGRTASGLPVSKGIIAADPRLLPLGSRVRLEAGAYSGEYLVADTGGSVRGKRIDIWTPTSREAMRFGRRTVKLTVLALGGKKRASR